MLLAVLFLDNETGDIGTVNARLSVAAFNGRSVSAVFAVNSNTVRFQVLVQADNHISVSIHHRFDV